MSFVPAARMGGSSIISEIRKSTRMSADPPKEESSSTTGMPKIIGSYADLKSLCAKDNKEESDRVAAEQDMLSIIEQLVGIEVLKDEITYDDFIVCGASLRNGSRDGGACARRARFLRSRITSWRGTEREP